MIVREVDNDTWQRQRLKLPKGDVTLSTGLILRPIVGASIEALKRIPRFKETAHGILEYRAWQHASGFLVTASADDTEKFGVLLHVSMSYPFRDPTWDEIKAVRAAFFPPSIDVMMVLPKETNYVNLHEHCFHLWQMNNSWDIG